MCLCVCGTDGYECTNVLGCEVGFVVLDIFVVLEVHHERVTFILFSNRQLFTYIAPFLNI